VKPIQLEVVIDAPPESVFSAMTDPARMPRWLPTTEAIEDPSGPIGAPGASFTQKGAPGFRRPGRTIAASPPSAWRIELVGFGERVDADFHLDDLAGSTRVRLEARVDNGPALLRPLMNRLGSGLDRRSWNGALTRLKTEVERPTVPVGHGTVYSMNTGAGVFRIGQVIDADDRYAHLRLYAQRFGKRPDRSRLTELRIERPGHYGEIQPLSPTIMGAVARGPRIGWLLVDGGFGLPHVPMTRRAFDDAMPEALLNAAVADEQLFMVDEWRHRGGSAFGEAAEPSVGAYLSVARGRGGFGVVKLLHSEQLGVHVRVYDNVFTERPSVIDERDLDWPQASSVTGRSVSEPFAIGHLPISHSAFARWEPEIVSLTLVDHEELLGYEEWKLAKGGFF
jgi:hypothetical protein